MNFSTMRTGYKKSYPYSTEEPKKLTSVFCASCPVIDHEFRHHIVEVAVDPRGDS